MRSSIDEASATALLRAANSAMYRAKQDGRGCVRVAGASRPSTRS